MLGEQLFGLDRVAVLEPLGFLIAQRSLQKVAGRVKAQNGQTALLGAGAGAGQCFKQGFLAQHRIDGLRQRGTFAGTKIAVVAEIARHHGISRVLELEGQLDQFGASVEKGFGMHSPYCPTAAKSRYGAGCCTSLINIAASACICLFLNGFLCKTLFTQALEAINLKALYV